MIAAIIVHHQHYPQVLESVRNIAEQVDRVLLVDNSEDESIADALLASREVKEGSCGLLVTPNDGYAASVNAGFRTLLESGATPDYVLVCTHEVMLAPGCVEALVAAGVDAAGPTLDGWSSGGYSTSLMSWPRHYPTRRTSGDAEWLDGACVLYSARALGEGLDEHFFLYGEEREFHTRLRKLGYQVAWVPEAYARQETAGTPAYFEARGQQLFVRLHGNLWQRMFSTPALIVRRAVSLLGRGRRYDVSSAVRGWRGAAKPVRRPFGR